LEEKEDDNDIYINGEDEETEDKLITYLKERKSFRIISLFLIFFLILLIFYKLFNRT